MSTIVPNNKSRNDVSTRNKILVTFYYKKYQPLLQNVFFCQPKSFRNVYYANKKCSFQAIHRFAFAFVNKMKMFVFLFRFNHTLKDMQRDGLTSLYCVFNF